MKKFVNLILFFAIAILQHTPNTHAMKPSVTEEVMPEQFSARWEGNGNWKIVNKLVV